MGHAHFDFKCWHIYFSAWKVKMSLFSLYLANAAGICFKQQIYFSLPTVNFCICCCGRIGGRQGGLLALNIIFITFQIFIHKVTILFAQALAFSEQDNTFRCTEPYIILNLLVVLQLTLQHITMWRPYSLLEQIVLCHAASQEVSELRLLIKQCPFHAYVNDSLKSLFLLHAMF